MTPHAAGQEEAHVHHVLRLQGTVGNAAVATLLTGDSRQRPVRRSAVHDVQRVPGKPRPADTSPPGEAVVVQRAPGGEQATRDLPYHPAGERRAAKRARVERANLLTVLQQTRLADYLSYRSLANLATLDTGAAHPWSGVAEAAADRSGTGGALHGPSGIEVQKLVLDKVGERFPRLRQRFGTALYGASLAGVLWVLRDVDDRELGDDPVVPDDDLDHGPGEDKMAGALQDTLKHVGYRQYAAAQAEDTVHTPKTLEAYGNQVLTHARLNEALRRLPEALRLPVRWLDDTVDPLFREDLDTWMTETQGLRGSRPHDPTGSLDEDAERLRVALGAREGDHVSLVDVSQGGTKAVAVYLNKSLPQRPLDIPGFLRGRGYQKVEVHFGTRPQGMFAGKDRWTRRHGILRAEEFDYSFHSEMQPSLRFDPWLLRGYIGNAYPSCPQCTRGLAALGIPAQLHRGSHEKKAASVIPPAIRENTVYLQHYLGATLWDKWSARLIPLVTPRPAPAPGGEQAPLDDAAVTELTDRLSELRRVVTAIHTSKFYRNTEVKKRERGNPWGGDLKLLGEFREAQTRLRKVGEKLITRWKTLDEDGRNQLAAEVRQAIADTEPRIRFAEFAELLTAIERAR